MVKNMFLFKFFSSFTILVLLLFGSPAFSDSIDPVVDAIRAGSSSDLAEYFESSISLNIDGQQGDYSKSQAEIVLKDFFKKNPPLGFSIVFKSETNSSLSSYIGEYKSSQNQFRVLIKISQQGANSRIYSLEFVED
jgi:hypothetical protein